MTQNMTQDVKSASYHLKQLDGPLPNSYFKHLDHTSLPGNVCVAITYELSHRPTDAVADVHTNCAAHFKPNDRALH